jgi:predicted cytidylate kinase
MTAPRTVVLNGDLGSGKTTVSVALAERLGVRRVSIGDLYRQMAAEHGMTALQFNLHAELDDKIDHYIDQLQYDIAASGEPLVVDSRLAWHFFRGAYKVHLITDPVVAARRVMGRAGGPVERYRSIKDACTQLAARSESERQRFLTRYGADKTRLQNYDLICDTTSASPADVVTRIVEWAATPTCLLDPRRIRRTSSTDSDGEVRVVHRNSHFFAVRGGRRLDAAVHAGETLIPVQLDEAVRPGSPH